MTRTPVRVVRVRIGSRTIRSTRFIAMISAVFICKLTTLLFIATAPPTHFLLPPLPADLLPVPRSWQGHTRTVGEITEEQQRDLIKTFEKRVAVEETQIRHDYFDMKKADKGERMLAFIANPNSPQVEETWMTCVYQFCKTLAVARQALFKTAQYGDTSIVHTFPSTNVKPTASASGWHSPSNPAASASSRSTSDLVQQRSERRTLGSS